MSLRTTININRTLIKILYQIIIKIIQTMQTKPINFEENK